MKKYNAYLPVDLFEKAQALEDIDNVCTMR